MRLTGLVIEPSETFQLAFFVDEPSVMLGDGYNSYDDDFPPEYRVAWWAPDPKVLRVDETGLVRGVAPGEAVVWVQVENQRDSARVRVTGAEPAGPRYTSIHAAGAHTCALAQGAEPYCWGSDAYGPLGRGIVRWFTNQAAPRPISGGHMFRQLASGSAHSCGLTAAGQAWCWGINSEGELGIGWAGSDPSGLPYVSGVATPTAVVGGIQFDTLVAGSHNTCGLDTSGTAYCWGSNFGWSLGNGSPDGSDDRPEPTLVAGNHTFRLLAGGYHHCGVTVGDETYCWGSHNYAVPSGPGSTWYEPVLVPNAPPFVALVAGLGYTCGLTATREPYCWGGNDEGQLGLGDVTPRPSPTRLPGALEFVMLAASNFHTCGLTPSGAAYCWGENNFGQLGRGDRNFTANPEPQVVDGGLTFKTISAASTRTCAVTVDGAAYCWGLVDSALGIGRIKPFVARERLVSAVPVKVVVPFE
jgi:alpha-tubulin suppressor-like RCC1 family protein